MHRLYSMLETVHMALCIHLLYEYLIIAWGNLLAAAKIIPSVIKSISATFELAAEHAY